MGQVGMDGSFGCIDVVVVHFRLDFGHNVRCFSLGQLWFLVAAAVVVPERIVAADAVDFTAAVRLLCLSR